MAGQEGDTATGPGGQKFVVQGGKLVPVQTIGAPVRAGNARSGRSGATPQEQITLNRMTENAASAGEVRRQYAAAAPVIKRLGTGPFRGAFLDAATAEDGGGFWDKIGAALVGVPAKLTGAVTDQDTADFTNLKALQARRVLAEQTLQKGVQTEGDATRIKAGDIGPYMPEATNLATAERGVGMADRSAQRAAFYTAWTNKYGLNGVNENGQAAEQVFSKWSSQQRPPASGSGSSGITVRRISD
jgi:hypothetical protein